MWSSTEVLNLISALLSVVFKQPVSFETSVMIAVWTIVLTATFYNETKILLRIVGILVGAMALTVFTHFVIYACTYVPKTIINHFSSRNFQQDLKRAVESNIGELRLKLDNQVFWQLNQCA